MTSLIITTDLTTTEQEAAFKTQDMVKAVKALFEKHVDREVLEGYRLPVSDSRARVVVGISGGVDSSVLTLFAAVYLKPRYPNIECLFTDTKAEPESCYATLDKIESLGMPITRVEHGHGLFGLIDKYNGFLPNSLARWCTRELKVEMLMNYMKSVDNPHGFINLAGIRYDEADREGISFQYSMETEATAAFPFIDLKLTKSAIFDIMDRSVGIPATYAYRSRSGCYSCFFQRNQEIIGMLQYNAGHFAKTESYEKLTEDDQQRWPAPDTLADHGIRGSYPVPAFVDIRKPEVVPEKAPEKVKVKKDAITEDLFADAGEPAKKSLFVAFALYVHGGLSWFGGREFTPGVYWQDLVTVSTSLSGLKSALGNYYSFKMTTPMPHCDAKDMKIVIAQVDFEEGVIDTEAPSKDSFTWKSGTSYAQLRHLVKYSQAALERKDLIRRHKDAVELMNTTEDEDVFLKASEDLEGIKYALVASEDVEGDVVWEGIYTPSRKVDEVVQMQLAGLSVETERKVAREGLEFDEVPMACISCSI